MASVSSASDRGTVLDWLNSIRLADKGLRCWLNGRLLNYGMLNGWSCDWLGSNF